VLPTESAMEPAMQAFTGAAEGAGGEGGNGLVEVGIRHDDEMVFGAAGSLDALAVARAGFVDVFGDCCGADEGDGLDEGMGEESVDAFLITVDDVEDTVGDAGFDEKLAEQVGAEGDFLAGFEDERVAADQGDGEHPQGDHHGEIERSDSDADAQGMSDGFSIDSCRDIGEGLAHEKRGAGAGEFDDFDAALHAGAGFGFGLAVFERNALGEAVEVFQEQLAEFEKDLGPLDGGRLRPVGQRGGGGFDHPAGFGGGAKGNVGDRLAGGRIEDVGVASGVAGLPFAGAEEGDEFYFRG
jgi:hypothetical protein